MKIIIDGDGTPKEARRICEELSNKKNINIIVVSSYDHDIRGEFDVVRVSKGQDSADFKIVELFNKGDILVTQDYGLASLVLNRAKAVINPSGFLYTQKNIDNLLHSRYIGRKIRQAGGRTKGPSKRSSEDDEKFKSLLYEILN
ncbi:MAG: DUF188 domain-containing protein [Tissierellales bacterium]|jgi:uncharacterized protein YaiI (UPF0178 family)|nr:DUF188 domain-containing protein [Tissierellales bacterium]HCX03819.1 hypothetical protein [Clostridiales bacterium]